MDAKSLPTYAVFDDYRYTQRVAVAVRWFLIAVWLVLHNYAPTINADYFGLNSLVLSLATFNGYVHWRIRKGRLVNWGYVVAQSGMDLVFITVGIAVTSAFENSFFVFYYPALLGLSLVASSRRLSFAVVTLESVVYARMSLFIGEGPVFSFKEEKILAVRYDTAEAQVRIKEALSGVSEELLGLGLAVQKAEQRTEDMQARVSAIDSLVDLGVLDSPSASAGGLPQLPSAAGVTVAVEEHLTALKREVGQGTGVDESIPST